MSKKLERGKYKLVLNFSWKRNEYGEVLAHTRVTIKSERPINDINMFSARLNLDMTSILIGEDPEFDISSIIKRAGVKKYKVLSVDNEEDYATGFHNTSFTIEGTMLSDEEIEKIEHMFDEWRK